MLHERGSVLCLTQRLLALRRRAPALQIGDYEPAEAPDGCFAYRRCLGGAQLLVALSFAPSSVEVPLPRGGSLLVSTDPARRVDRRVDGALCLGPEEGCIVALEVGDSA